MSDWSEEYRRGYIHGKSKGIKKGLKMRKGYVRVVRCKDCKHFLDGGCGNTVSLSPSRNLLAVMPDWYCADGERKDDE